MVRFAQCCCTRVWSCDGRGGTIRSCCKFPGLSPRNIATRADVAVAELAAGQNAVVSTRQLTACGVDSGAVTVRVRRGQLHRVHRGVYAVGTGLLTLRGELTAAVLACGDGAVLSHHAAAAWWELLAWEPRSPEVIVPGGAGRGLDGIRPRWSRSPGSRRAPSTAPRSILPSKLLFAGARARSGARISPRPAAHAATSRRASTPA
jgi:hypothetical protein